MPHIVSAAVAVENQIRGQVGSTSGASAASSIAGAWPTMSLSLYLDGINARKTLLI